MTFNIGTVATWFYLHQQNNLAVPARVFEPEVECKYQEDKFIMVEPIDL